MIYDANPRVLEWFESVLGGSSPDARRRALELLTRVDGPRRDEWLARAATDPDADVRATALLVTAAAAAQVEIPGQDLLESDFAQGVDTEDLQWEWEYGFVPCRGLHVPGTGILVWTLVEDDEIARSLAVLKASAGTECASDVVAVMAAKRFVNTYTRSPRSFVEAMRWHQFGRPRYPPS